MTTLRRSNSARGLADDLQVAGLQLGHFEPGELPVGGSGLRPRGHLGIGTYATLANP